MRLDRKEYENVAREAVAEGIVMLKNEGDVLPLREGSKVALFGRMQNHYYKSGTGSGGMVNVSKLWGIKDALLEEKIELNQSLLEAYKEFDKTHPYDLGTGFGTEKWSQEEMALSDDIMRAASKESEIAVVIIGRTAGEEQDYNFERGVYLLSELEVQMLKKVRANFSKMVLLLNVSAVLNMADIEESNPDSILYVWQGGEIGGLGTADVLMGRKNPSGKLADSIVKNIEDVSAYKYFGNREYNCYSEDVYVGYRYYETFKPETVLYPFGFGLSYTSFEIEAENIAVNALAEAACAGKNTEIRVNAVVKNTGNCAGKEVVQLYVSKPQGKLGQPALSLAGFVKTDEIGAGKEQKVTISFIPYYVASYDDSGVTGNKSAYVLEAGDYEFFVGNSSKELTSIGKCSVSETVVVDQLAQQMAPVRDFKRVKPECKGGVITESFEDVPKTEKVDIDEAKADKPEFLPYTGDKGIKLADVMNGKASMDEFLAQLSDEDLSCIIRGEGMGSPKVTTGTAAAFGGVSENLKNFGIPCACCSDGPSGMRLDSGAKAFSLPNGTLLACTWNTAINEQLFGYLGKEMTKNKVDVLLGPGINIHRHPLNGRNFEYFSEDPLVTGKMAAAQIRGLKSAGASGTLKHFCANNQETNRHWIDSVVSERALREIYLKGFELAIKEGGADSVMTTYGSVNGAWTAGRHDMNTNILRNEWGFKGVVMTDWWANIGDFGGKVSKADFARMVRAQNDFYAVCPEADINSSGDNTLQELNAGNITRGHLCRSAANICSFLIHTHAMERFLGNEPELELVNFNDDDSSFDTSNIAYHDIDDGAVIDLSAAYTERGCCYAFGVDIKRRGCYFMDLTGKSDLSELAQIPITIYCQSVPNGSYTFTGTAGEWVTQRKKILFHTRYSVIRFYFGNSGLQLKDLKFTLEKEINGAVDFGDYPGYIWG